MAGTSAGTVFIDVLPNMGKFHAALAAQAKSVQGRNADGTFAGLSKRATVMTAVAAGLGFAIKKSVDAATEWETAFTGVKKTVDATAPELERLGKGIRELSKEIPATTTEIAAVAEAAGQLGIQTDAILGFTRTMVDLGETTNLSATEAAESLARLANITQMPQDQFDRLGSTVVDLGNKLASTEAEIVEMGLRIAGAGKQIGLSEAQILGLAGALSSVGINAEAGGSAISRVLINMARDVETGSGKLKVFARIAGMTTQQFSKAFRKDAAGALTTLIERLGGMGKGGAIGALEQLGITEVRTRDAMLRLAGAGGLLRRSLNTGSKAWRENNALTTEAEKRYETFQARLQVFKNTVKDVGITIGTSLLPALGRVVSALGTAINAIVRATEALARFLGQLASADVIEGTSRLGHSVRTAGKGGIPSNAGGGRIGPFGVARVGEHGPELVAVGRGGARVYNSTQAGNQALYGVLMTAFGPAEFEAQMVDIADSRINQAIAEIYRNGM